MIVRTVVAACALVALAACQPAEPAADKEGDAADHAALAAVDPLISEALVASRTPDSMMVEDPCGSGKGPAGASPAWVNAEMVKRGYTAEQVCAMFGPGATASERIKDMGVDELGAFTRMMDDRAALMRTALEAQGREIEKIAEGR